jgi:hypothetical protein
MPVKANPREKRKRRYFTFLNCRSETGFSFFLTPPQNILPKKSIRLPRGQIYPQKKRPKRKVEKIKIKVKNNPFSQRWELRKIEIKPKGFILRKNSGRPNQKKKSRKIKKQIS